MGNIFRRRRQATEELEEIVMQIKELEMQVSEHLESRADFLRTLIYGMLGLFGAMASYVWLQYRVMSYRILALSGSMIATIVLFIVLRMSLITVYDYVIQRKRKRIQYFMDRKFTIIEDVKENEKFKVAKEIIEKYSSKEDLANLLKTDIQTPAMKEKNTKTINETLAANTLAVNDMQRNLSNLTLPLDTTNLQKNALKSHNTPLNAVPKLHEIGSSRFSRTPVRPFVNPSSNPIDRILDYVMGESINNRYALICVNCHAHNGMALKEEFEQIAYFCFKCGTYNPSRNEFKATQCHSNASPQESSKSFSSFRLDSINEAIRQSSRSHSSSRTPSISSFSAVTGGAENSSITTEDQSVENSSNNGSINEDE